MTSPICKRPIEVVPRFVVIDKSLILVPSSHTSVVLEAPFITTWNSRACQPLPTDVALVSVVALTSFRKLSLPDVLIKRYPIDASAEVR